MRVVSRKQREPLSPVSSYRLSAYEVVLLLSRAATHRRGLPLLRERRRERQSRGSKIKRIVLFQTHKRLLD